MSLFWPSLSFYAAPARGAEEDTEVPQARFLGYEKEYKIQSSNVTLVYFYWVVFVAGAVGAMFIKTKRTFQD